MSELRFKIASVWRGEWSDNETYNVLDEVSFSGDIEEIKHGNYRSLLADNKEPLSNESAWALILDLEKTQSATQEAEEMNEAFKIAENERKNKENERKANEELRKSAETKRENEESKRITNERTRVSYETSRNDAETNRRAKENERDNNEQSRKLAEIDRDEYENKRIAAEIQRNDNETLRKNQENAREIAEANRVTEFTNAQNERAEAFNAAEAGRDAKIDAKVEDITRLQGEVAKKANIDGYYSSMAVGAAESLIGQNVTTQQFTYQPTGNTLDVQDGRAVVKSIKGNTVVANQIFKYSNVLDNESGTYKFCVGIYNFPLNHKLLIKFNYSNSNPNLTTISYGLSKYGSLWGSSAEANVSVGDNIQVKSILTNLDASNTTLYIYSSNPLTGFSVDTNSIQIVDLTQMFGAGNEPATVEEFERLYPNLQKEYNAGSLLNLNAERIKSVGFNLFDKTKISPKHYINPTTKLPTHTDTDKECVSDYIRVIPNATYFVKNFITISHRQIALYNENKEHITPNNNIGFPANNEIEIDSKYLTNSTWVVPEGVHYIRAGIYDDYVDSACINLSHSGYRNGEYEPYKESIVNLPIKDYFPDGMKSAGEVRDEIVWDESIGKYKAIQRVGSVDMGNLNWSCKNSSLNPNIYPYGFFETNITERKEGRDVVCAIYSKNIDFKLDKMLVPASAQSTIYVVDSSYTDAASFKLSLQGQSLYYELQTPIETIIDDYDGINYEVSDFGTEEIISDEPTTPIVIDVVYGVNAVDTLRRLPQTYISADSMRDFLAQLGSAMNGNWAMEYDDVNSKWTFTFTANEVVNNEE